jgi:hypothetical protein
MYMRLCLNLRQAYATSTPTAEHQPDNAASLTTSLRHLDADR